jgi:hypothetical protein
VTPADYRRILSEECSEADWREVVRRAVDDATRAKRGGDRARARRWLSDLLLGEPKSSAVNVLAVGGTTHVGPALDVGRLLADPVACRAAVALLERLRPIEPGGVRLAGEPRRLDTGPSPDTPGG